MDSKLLRQWTISLFKRLVRLGMIDYIPKIHICESEKYSVECALSTVLADTHEITILYDRQVINMPTWIGFAAVAHEVGHYVSRNHYHLMFWWDMENEEALQRGSELQADLLGCKFLALMGQDPQNLIRYLKGLVQFGCINDEESRSHPSPSRRINVMKKLFERSF